MPGVTAIKILGHLKFMSAQLGMPTSDADEPPDDQQLSDGLQESQELPPAPPGCIPPFFMAKRFNKQDTTSSNDIGNEFKDFHDKAIDAVVYAVDMWKLQAKVKDLKVNAVTALGSPGCLDGPELESNIKNAPSTAAMQDNYAKYRDAVAAGVSANFKDWADNVMVPGLPWYPAFAAYPGPMAAPTPNIPVPLIICPSSSLTKITMPSELKDAMVGELDSGLKDEDVDKQHETLFDSIGTVLALGFLIWMASQQAMLVMGKGPVPTFAPPYVPVGPVVMGDNIGAPGHTMA